MLLAYLLDHNFGSRKSCGRLARRSTALHICIQRIELQYGGEGNSPQMGELAVRCIAEWALLSYCVCVCRGQREKWRVGLSGDMLG